MRTDHLGLTLKHPHRLNSHTQKRCTMHTSNRA